jgi:hypothetical protein
MSYTVIVHQFESETRHVTELWYVVLADLQVRVRYEREGRLYKATIVRMAVARVKSIKDLMELMTTAATYARHKQDATAVRHCSETLDGVVQILVQSHEFEQRAVQRIQQVPHVGKLA